MRNLSGYLKKTPSRSNVSFSITKILICSLLLLSTLIPNHTLRASSEEPVSISSSIKYEIDKYGTLKSNVTLKFTNTGSKPAIINQYNLNLPFTNISAFKARKGNIYIPAAATANTSSTDFVLTLNDQAVSSKESFFVSLTFNVAKYANTEQELKSIDVPVVISEADSDTTIIKYHNYLGEVSTVVGASSSIDKGGDYTTITVSSPSREKVTLNFDEIKAYEFTISRTLENSGEISIVSEISLPQARHNQEITISSVTPIPDHAFQDTSGNTFIAYTVQPGQVIEAKINGGISFTESNYKKLVYPEIGDYLKRGGFWEIRTDSDFTEFDKLLRTKGINFTNIPGDISELQTEEQRQIVYKAAYDYTLLKLDPSTKNNEEYSVIAGRQGADELIGGSKESTAEDYSDLLLALLRAYNVPSQQTIGYVSNITAQFEDQFIHTWAEYWDIESGWHVSDPYLEEILGSSMHDFNNTDHLVIVSRVESSLAPNISFFSPNEATFVVTQQSQTPIIDVEITSDFRTLNVARTSESGNIVIKNQGNSIIYVQDIVEDSAIIKPQFASTELIVPGQVLTIPVEYNVSHHEVKSHQEEGLPLKFTVIVKSVGGDISNEIHNITVPIETYWWWRISQIFVSTLIFLVTLGLVYNVVKNREMFTKIFNRKDKSTKYD